MNSIDPLNVGGNIQRIQEDTPRKVDTFMQYELNGIKELSFVKILFLEFEAVKALFLCIVEFEL
ncbi:hypothetical protein WUBG_07177 [Wuchereria bancrofti]|uniref:Uncharacterized protein n=1 Tax=Wuchereria bancrofti TaxID=6293 RepID=J9F3K0_WUCBA|nr:hypothetical protein WUBG_07177 [Wuchereria bancrofti]